MGKHKNKQFFLLKLLIFIIIAIFLLVYVIDLNDIDYKKCKKNRIYQNYGQIDKVIKKLIAIINLFTCEFKNLMESCGII
jgi:hypothetical protein